ncbi:hypothetical protein BKA69DRAFT_229747 [Paraphysoderma sedebokerense]|nr:hypothetical protein BKA69DRAFT_229747 [Paraphysoderma sedebokerense]
MGEGIVGNLYPTDRYGKTAALGINTAGDVFVATYSPFSKSKYSLNIHKINPSLTAISTLKMDQKYDGFWSSQYKNPRIKLFLQGTNNLFVGFFNYPAGNAKGIWLSRHQYGGSIPNPNDKLTLTNQNAYTIDFECKSATICVWMNSRRVTEYSMAGFSQGSTTDTSTTSPELQFDPAITSSAVGSYFLHHLLNDPSRFVVHGRDSAFASLGASISPYVVNNAFDQSNFDIQVDGGQIYVGFTSTLNSSLSLGNSEIVISQYSGSYQLQSSIILSTVRLDSLTRLLPVSNNKIMAVGMTEGDLSNPTLNSGSRRAFVAHFQYFWITTLQTASPGFVRGGENFVIAFSSLPSSATSNTPSVTLNGRSCTVRGWIGQNLNVSAAYGIGGMRPSLGVIYEVIP